MLELKNITLQAGNRLLLEQPLSLTVKTGTTVVVFGRNGSGKTTLLKTIAGHVPVVKSGEIIYNGQSIQHASVQKRASICVYNSAKEMFFTSIQVYDYLLYARLRFTGGLGLYSPNDKAMVNEWAEKLHLTHLLNNDYNTLSDGEKQRVSIARAFIYETPIVLFDEPTSNLDLPAKKSVTKMLHDFAASEHKIIIYSTHDYAISKDYCTQTWFIDKQGCFHNNDFNALRNVIEIDFELL